ncbi:MAG: magnesium transporter MgtE [Isosphaeraceae bacterium]|jgi:magnesium transporter|nr:MAG: magnesium transporter MgtE [Isosphaeraceae bacterium]
MPLRNPLLVPDLRELIQAGETAAVRDFLADLHPGQVAELVEDFGAPEGDKLLNLLDPRQRAEVFGYIDGENQIRLIEAMDPADAAAMLHVMSHDERADLVQRLDDDIVDGILRRLAHAEREDIRRLASYEPGTAGAVMTTDYATLPPHITVREAIDRLRQEAPDRETIYYNYVVDENRRLLGFVSLKDLFLARPRARVDEIMKTDLIVARLDEDQESVAKKVEEYDLIAIPVVDAEDRLVGIVTYDDAADILRQEQAEDLIRFGGVSPDPEADSEPYWQSSAFTSVRRRIKWLLMLFVAENFTYPVFEHFKWLEGDSYFPSLGFFVALLIGTGGNAGSQTVSTVIRGLALGEIKRRDIWRVLGREALTGLILGCALGLTGLVYSHFYRHQPWGISLVVGLTLLCICLWANTIGSLVPLVATRFGLDPAVISAPFITTLVDATGLIIYYSIAIFILLRLGFGTG